MTNDVFELAAVIKHLTIEQIEDLYIKYLSGEKNSELVKEFDINIHPNKLISILPPQKLEDTLCPYCDISMYQKRKSKNQSKYNTPPIECIECSHKIYQDSNAYYKQTCDCDMCLLFRQQEKIEAEKETREKIRKIYNINNRETAKYSELTFFQKLILLTLFRMQTEEDFEYIAPLNTPTHTEPLSPTLYFDIECIKELYHNNVIIVDPESPIEAFHPEKDFATVNAFKTRWIPNITLDNIGDSDRATLDTIYTVIYKEMYDGIKSEWERDIHRVLFLIAREEILQYIHILSEELNVNFTAENKTREVVKQLLEKFSVSEIYYFAKKSIENAHIFYSKGYAHSKKHAANTIPSKMLSLGERAVEEKWDTYKYNRDKRAPRSYLSKIFFDFFLRDEDSGFHKAPGKHWESDLYPKYFRCKDSEQEKTIYCNECKSDKIKIRAVDQSLELTCQTCGNITLFNQSKEKEITTITAEQT